MKPYAQNLQSRLRMALEVASLAPSSHNCQPWAVATGMLAGDSGSLHIDPAHSLLLVLALDRRRELRALPAHRLEMGLSCGAFLGLLTAGLTRLGFEHAVVWEDDGASPECALNLSSTWPAHLRPLTVLSLGERRPDSPNGIPSFRALRNLAQERCTNRLDLQPLQSGIIPPDSYVADGPQYVDMDTHRNGVQFWWSENSTENAVVGELLQRHGTLEFSHASAWRETLSYIRFSASEIRMAKDGFSIRQLLGPKSPIPSGLTKIVLSGPVMSFLGHVGFHRLLSRQLAHSVADSPILFALSWPDHQPPTWSAQLEAGAILVDFWLSLTDAGLALHPISVILQHRQAREDFERAIGAPGRVFFFARAGCPVTQLDPTPRRPVEDFWFKLQ